MFAIVLIAMISVRVYPQSLGKRAPLNYDDSDDDLPTVKKSRTKRSVTKKNYAPIDVSVGL